MIIYLALSNIACMMRLNITLFILFSFVCSPLLKSQDCVTTCCTCQCAQDQGPICSFDDLDGLQIEMTSQWSNQGPSPLCPGGGTYHNMSWFAFVAGSTTMDLFIQISACDTVEFNGQMLTGIQWGVYTDCNFNQAIACEPGCSDQDFNLNVPNLQIGETYYFFFDGCGGSACTYTINVVSGGGPPLIDESGWDDPICITNNIDCDMVCAGATIEMDLPGATLAIPYTWTASGGAIPAAQLIDDLSTKPEFTFPSAGVYTICVTADNGCDATDEVHCTDVTVVDIVDEVFTVDWCENEFPLTQSDINQYLTDNGTINPNGDIDMDGWQGGDVSAGGTFTHMVDDGWGVGCEYMQTLTVNALALDPPIMIDEAICLGDSYSIGGMTYTNEELGIDFVVEGGSANGCDQQYMGNVFLLDYELDIEASDCSDLGVKMTLEITNDGSGVGQNINYYWTFNGVQIPGSDNLACWYADPAQGPGTYSAVFNVSYQGATQLTECQFVPFMDFLFNPDDYLVLVNPEDGEFPLVVCEGENGSVTYVLDPGSNDPAAFNVEWTIDPPNAGTIISGQGGITVTIDWTDLMGSADLCYIVSNACSPGVEVCTEINLLQNPVPEIEMDTSICQGEEIFVDLNNELSSYDSLVWNFGGGTIIQGDMDGTGPGPFNVSWSGGPDTFVTVIIGYGCTNPVVDTVDIELITDPAFPTHECFPSGTDLVIDWADVDGADDYMVNVTMGPMGNLNGSQYEFTGLNANDEVCITVVANGADLCGPVQSMEFCCTLPDCPEVDLEVMTDIPSSICLDGSQGLGNLNLIDNLANGGDISWNGPGVADNGDGTASFDPSLAGTGTIIIEYLYELPGGCVSRDEVEVTLIQPPSYSISVEPSVVCEGDPVTISIDGLTNDDGNPVIDFAGGNVTGPDANGDYTVIWNTGGVKDIGASLAVAGCPDDVLAGAQVEVESLPTLDIECINTTTTTITFGWTDDNVYSSYDILIEGMLIDNVTGNSYTFTGLAPDSTITIQIFGNSTNSCIHEIEVKPCTANDCENVPFSIMNPLPSNVVCGSAPFDVINLDGVYDSSLLMGGESIDWIGTDPDGNTFAITDGEFTPTISGEYTIDAELSEANCSYGATISFTIEDVPDLALSQNEDVICIEDTWMLSYDGDPLGNYNFNWQGMPTEGDANMLSQGINFVNPGTYDLTLNASSDNCMSEAAMISVEVVDSTRTPTIFCEAGVDSIRIDWIVAPSDCNGSYTVFIDGVAVSVQDDAFYVLYGLSENESVEITIENENDQCICPSKSRTVTCMTSSCPAIPLEINIQDTVLCLTDVVETIDLDALYDSSILPDATETWSGTAVDANTGVFDPSVSNDGVFTIEVDISNGSCDYNVSTTVTVENVPELALDAPMEICIEDTWLISYIGEDVGSFNTTWSSNDINNVPTTGVDQDAMIDFDLPGMYTLYLDASSDNCASERDSISVVVRDSVLTPQITCESFVDSVVISISVDNSECSGALIIDSDFPGFPQTVVNNEFTMPLDPGQEFEFTITNSNTCGCLEKSTTLSCFAEDCPEDELTIGVDQQINCLDGGDINLQALLNGAPINTGLTWTGQGIGPDGTILIDQSFTAGDAVYMLQYQIGTCTYEASTTLTFVEPPVLTYGLQEPLCPGESEGILIIENPITDATYTLNGGSIDPTIPNSLNPGSYDLIVETGGVCSDDDSFEIMAVDPITFSIEGDDEVPFNDTGLYQLGSDQNITIDSIVWSTPDTSAISNDFEFSSATPVTLCATVYFNGGCSDELCRELSVEAKKVYIPNIFNPGSNDSNGGFEIFSNNVIENVNYIKIYDRWGNMVFNKEDLPPGDPDLIWYGDFNGQDLVQGVYVYVIELAMIGDQTRVYTGDITLVR